MRYPHGVLARAWQAPSRWLRVWSSSWATQIADLGAVTAGRRLDELAQMICARVLARCAYSDVREIGQFWTRSDAQGMAFDNVHASAGVAPARVLRERAVLGD
jgi:hypothetical protein